MSYQYIAVTTHERVGEINLNRPVAMNALCAELMNEVGDTPAEALHADALATASRIAAHSSMSTKLIKESINQAFETPLSSGLLFERRMFQICFASEDRTEGMHAFIEKRAPVFRDR